MSEDRITNFFVRKLKDGWGVVYYNPPHGSWKFVSFFMGDTEFRQVGPKRGKGKIKRPDLVLQDTNVRNKVVCLLLESKKSREEWNRDLPEMMKKYFEGAKDITPVYEIPFYHKKKEGMDTWQKTKKSERFWLKSMRREYLYGFAYGLGVTKKGPYDKERAWMKEQIESFPKGKVPPIFFAAVGWDKKSFNPFCILEFSPTFPRSYKMRILRKMRD